MVPTATFSDAEATNIEPSCPECNGRGYFLEDVPFGHPHFGVLFPCRCTMQAKERRANEDLLKMSNIEPSTLR